MMALLQLLFVGHVHKWQTIREVRLSDASGSTGTRYFQQCECCGKVIKRDLV